MIRAPVLKMASFHDNHESFSTSELFQNDETARAPELSPVPTVVATGFLSVPEVGRDGLVLPKAKILRRRSLG